MKTHIQIVAILNIAAGALYLIAALAIFLFGSMAGGIVASQGEHEAGSIVAIVVVVITAFLALLGLPSVIAGFGLYVGKSWARPLALVLAALHLPNVPIGTALGIYTFWALLSQETPARLPAQPTQTAQYPPPVVPPA